MADAKPLTGVESIEQHLRWTGNMKISVSNALFSRRNIEVENQYISVNRISVVSIIACSVEVFTRIHTLDKKVQQNPLIHCWPQIVFQGVVLLAARSKCFN